jgi:hypothetical protein
MIDVRVCFTDADGTFWTSPIRNERALAAMLEAHRERGVPTQVFDDADHAQQAEYCFDLARVPAAGGQRGTIVWGPHGRKCYCCEIARLPQATGMLHVPAGSTATQAAKCQPCVDDGEAELSRELRGPTAEDLEPHAPHLSVFDTRRDGSPHIPADPEGLRFAPVVGRPWPYRLLVWLFSRVGLGIPQEMVAR